MRFIMKNILHILLFSALLTPILLNSAACQKEETIPYTLELYKQCSEENIEQFSEESKKNVRSSSCYETHPIYRGGAKIACDLARFLLESYPNDTIYALGQSPAYIIAAARFIKEMSEGSSDQFHHITFSGKWWGTHGAGFTLNSETPSKESILHYRTHLEHIECTPEKIVERMRTKKQKTIIVEYTLSAESLYSFLHILSEWSKELGLLEKVAQSLEVCMLQGAKAGCFEKKMDTMHALPIHKHMLEGEIDEMMYDFSKADHYQDRLVPYYHFRYWLSSPDHIDPKNYTMPENAKYVLFELLKYLHVSEE